MAYNASYTTDDMSNILVDILGSAGATIVGFIGLIVLLGMVSYIVVKFRQIGKQLPK